MAVTIKDVAELAAVSTATVSLALRDNPKISCRNRQRIQRLAREMGYRPNLLARGVRTRRSNTIGIVLPHPEAAPFSFKIEAVEAELAQCGYQIVLTFTAGQVDRTLECLRDLQGRHVDGLVLGHGYAAPGDLAQVVLEIERMAIPTVVLDVEAGALPGTIPAVVIDRATAMNDLADHLREIARDDVVFFAGGGVSASNCEKWTGLHYGAAKANLRLRCARLTGNGWYEADRDVDPRHSWQEWHKGISKRSNAEQERWCRLKVRELMEWDEKPNALVFANDVMAMAAIQELHQADIAIPQDLVVVGYDDTAAARLFSPSLTTIRQPTEQIGQMVTKMLLSQIQTAPLAEGHKVIATELVIRRSTAG